MEYGVQCSSRFVAARMASEQACPETLDLFEIGTSVEIVLASFAVMVHPSSVGMVLPTYEEMVLESVGVVLLTSGKMVLASVGMVLPSSEEKVLASVGKVPSSSEEMALASVRMVLPSSEEMVLASEGMVLPTYEMVLLASPFVHMVLLVLHYFETFDAVVFG